VIARCIKCGGGIEVGNELALFVERAEGELVLEADSHHRWAAVLNPWRALNVSKLVTAACVENCHARKPLEPEQPLVSCS